MLRLDYELNSRASYEIVYLSLKIFYDNKLNWHYKNYTKAYVHDNLFKSILPQTHPARVVFKNVSAEMLRIFDHESVSSY